MEVLCKRLYPTLYPVHDPAAGPWGMPDERGNIQVRTGGGGAEALGHAGREGQRAGEEGEGGGCMRM